MHICKSREDMSDDTGKVYVQLWEEKKKILSRQKVSKALNTLDLMVLDDTTWSGYSEGLSTSERVTPLKSAPKSTSDQKKFSSSLKKKRIKRPRQKQD